MELLGLEGAPEDHAVQSSGNRGLSGAGYTGMHPGEVGISPDRENPWPPWASGLVFGLFQTPYL